MADEPMDELDRLAARSQAARQDAGRLSRRGNPLPWAISGLLFAFLLGMLASPWFETQVRGTIPGALAAGQRVEADPRIEDILARLQVLEARAGKPDRPIAAIAAPQPDFVRRLEILEALAESGREQDSAVQSRIDGLTAGLAQTGEAVAEGDARIRDLFLLAVARRMLEAGRPLTPLQASLDGRFRQNEVVSLDALRAWSLAPQTKRTLEGRLDSLEARATR
ncbi:MAG: hypothetical protein ACRC1J_01705, partial [Sandaracinobacteroides sp.]